jgi:hypothetical protein
MLSSSPGSARHAATLAAATAITSMHGAGGMRRA